MLKVTLRVNEEPKSAWLHWGSTVHHANVWRAGGMSSGVRAGIWKGRTLNAVVFYINGTQRCFFYCLIQSPDLKEYVVLQNSCTRQRQESQKSGSPMKSETWCHRVPYKYTGCLAHVEITERSSDGEVSRIMGYFLHNEGCDNAVLTHLPAVPLHEHVYEVALDQLDVGARYDLYETCFLLSVQPDIAYSTIQHYCCPNP